MLHLVDSLVERDDVGDLEECRLHDGIRTRTQSELGGDLRGVDDIEIDLVLGQIGFHMVGQRSAGGSRVVHRVEQERTAGFQPFQHGSYLKRQWLSLCWEACWWHRICLHRIN